MTKKGLDRDKKWYYIWLSEEGFRIKNEYGDYAGNPIGETTGRAIICAVLTEA